jgi:light-regulated signal transduction histidine kinase (bacteriophytochrome)
LDDAASSLGASFDQSALAHFDDWFCREQSEIIYFCNSLMRQVPELPLSEVAGVLAMRLKQRDGTELRLYLTRMEYIHEVAWGGSPEKPFETHDGLLGIAPRQSFEKWVEKRLGYSRPWDNESRLLGFKLRELLMQELSR